MCYRVDCKKCGKYSWGGCGKHLSTLYGSIEQGKHCNCRPWPGVVMPSSQTTTQNKETVTQNKCAPTTTTAGTQ
ncbi:hypothetical protein H5410_009256 [Solanum commersonii]|uniref:Uncharacterized protein n=1 Tax=Solanum commersonii TaxID=4109 RepID=A0A9J6AHC6_SOLCO|nr:hypothetical protein H5410_009256 [Solanum commersonii]